MSPVVVDADPPIMKRRLGETPETAQKAVGAHSTAVEAKALPGRNDGRMAATMYKLRWRWEGGEEAASDHQFGGNEDSTVHGLRGKSAD